VDEYLTEKEQWERIIAGARAYAPWALVGVAIGALAIGGWRWWQARSERLGLEASAQYEQVLTAFDQGNRDRGLALIDQLQREHAGSPYLDQANLAAARVLVEAAELDRAAQRLSSVVEHSRDPQLATIARLRLARVQIALGKPDEALKTLAAAPGEAFAGRYHEVRGDAYYAKHDPAAALTEYRAARSASAPGSDNQLLTLKIDDLTQNAAPAAAAADTTPAAPVITAPSSPASRAAPAAAGK